MRFFPSAIFNATALALLAAGCNWAGIVVAPIVVPSPVVPLGSIAAVEVQISGLGLAAAPSLSTFDLNIGFDPSILSLQSAVFGDPVLGDQLNLSGLGSIQTAIPGLGTVELFEVSLDSVDDLNNLQAAAFTLAQLRFSALALGNSPLQVTLNALGDAYGNPLDATVQSGSLTVTPTPEPGSLALVLLGMAALCGSRRTGLLIGRASALLLHRAKNGIQ